MAVMNRKKSVRKVMFLISWKKLNGNLKNIYIYIIKIRNKPLYFTQKLLLDHRFEWAGVGFGEEESFRIFKSLTVKMK